MPPERRPRSDEDEAMLTRLLAREGGYVDDAADPGGCTHMGVTLETLRRFRQDSTLTCRDLRLLRQPEARAIYATFYLHGPGIGQIADPRLRELVLDFAVHSGPGRAVRALQQALGIEDDGDLGPETLEALAQQDPAEVWLAVWKRRLRFLCGLVAADPSKVRFLAGWVNRLLGLL